MTASKSLPFSVHDDSKAESLLKSSKYQMILYMTVFFLAMIAHELALEAATTEFQHLDALAFAVTLFQFGFCVLLPVSVSRGKALHKFPRKSSAFLPYIWLSITVFGASGLASQSLRYVTYPTKVVFKSAKLIPTMIVATFVQGKVYKMSDYIAAALLCIGAAGYSWGGGRGQAVAASAGGNPTSHEGPSEWPGIVLLTISIFCDALVPNLQQRLMTSPDSSNNIDKKRPPILSESSDSEKDRNNADHPEVGNLSPAELMVNVNSVGFVGLAVYMAAVGHLTAIAACSTHPRLMLYLSLVGMGLGIAVLAYTKLIQVSGSVVAVAVATLRKVATVILSYIVFPKPILPIHVISGLVVLAGILLSTYNCRSSSSKGVTSKA